MLCCLKDVWQWVSDGLGRCIPLCNYDYCHNICWCTRPWLPPDVGQCLTSWHWCLTLTFLRSESSWESPGHYVLVVWHCQIVTQTLQVLTNILNQFWPETPRAHSPKENAQILWVCKQVHEIHTHHWATLWPKLDQSMIYIWRWLCLVGDLCFHHYVILFSGHS